MTNNEAMRFLQLLGAEQVKLKGNKISASCPVAGHRHSGGRDSTPSFVMWPRAEMAKCYACSWQGHARKLVWDLMKMTKSVNLKAMMLAYPMRDEDEDTPLDSLDYRLGGVVPSAQPIARIPTYGKDDQKHWVNRGQEGLFGGRTQQPQKYEPPSEETIKAFVDAGIPEAALKRFPDWVCREWEFGDDKAKRRWVFPIRGFDGKLVGMTERLYWPEDYCWADGADIVKMVDIDGTMTKKRLHNCPKCDRLYSKYAHHPGMPLREVLYGAHKYVPGTPVVLVEGSTDVIRLWQYGVRSPVAVLSSSLTWEQLALLRGKTETVYTMGDGDEAGWLMNDRNMKALKDAGFDAHEVRLETGDPDTASEEEIRSLLPKTMFVT